MQCLVLFAVRIRVHRTLLTSTKVLLAQNVFPLTSLKPGEESHIIISIFYNAIKYRCIRQGCPVA